MKTLHSSRGRSKGFTLIEIIAVIIIIGLMAAVIAVSMDNRVAVSSTRKEAQTFMQAIDFVSEQAVLNGEIIAMFVAPKESEDALTKQWCYTWKRFRDNSWQDLPEDSLSEHCMQENMEWDLVIEEHLYTYDPDLEPQPPVLVWSPSGEATPLEMKLYENSSRSSGSNKSEVQHIEIDMMGNSHWLEQEEEDERGEPKKR